MGKEEQAQSKKYFSWNATEAKFKCLVGGCKIQGFIKEHVGNFNRHLVTLHPDIAESIGLQVKRKHEMSEDRLTQSRSIKKFSVPIDPDEFRCGLVEMVSSNAIPFNFFNSKACKKTLCAVGKALGITVNANTVSVEAHIAAHNIREVIAEKFKNKLVCLKFDCATRHERRILGVVGQIVQNGKIEIYTLSMLEMHSRQTIANLKDHILEVLKQYKIDITNIYTGTVDNGKNVRGCVRKLGAEQAVALQGVKDIDYDIELNNDGEGEIDDEGEIGDEGENSDEESEDNSDIEIESAELELRDILETNGAECLDTVRCAAHTIQLAVNGSIGDDLSSQISSIRSKLKEIKTMQYRALFLMAKVPLPKMSVVTRWGSLFEMLQGVKNHQEFYTTVGENNDKVKIVENEWTIISNFLEAYDPVHKLTKELQTEDFIIGDMLRAIKVCQLKLSKVAQNGNPYVENLQKEMERRCEQLFDSSAVKSALFFDPRWNFVDSPFFSKDDKARAIDHILKMSRLLQRFKNNNITVQSNEDSNKSSNEDDEFERSLAIECIASSSNETTSEVDIKLKLLSLANAKQRADSKADVLKYWESRKYDDPELYPLAITALSVPCTQVSVERCFSAVKLLLEDHRLRLSPQKLDDLMIIRLNADLLPEAMKMLRAE